MNKNSTKRKIVFIIPSLVGGGAERVLTCVINFLNQDKYDMHLVVFEKKGVYLSSVPAYVKIYNLQKRGRFSFPTLVVRLAILLNKIKPDTAIGFLSYANLITVLAKIVTHVKMRIIINEQIHLSTDLAYGRLSKLKKILYRIFYRSADLCIVPSEGIREDLVKFFRLDKQKIRVIHNPIDLDMINRSEEEEIDDILPGKYILAAGRLTPQKGFDYLLKAYALIAYEIEENLVILGEGEMEGNLKKLARQLGIDKKVYFLGFQENPYKFMHHASLFVLSSLWESFALVVAEAMESGVPVVATDCPVGPGEIITDGVNGILVPPADETSLAKAMSRLLKDEDLKKRLTGAGQARAKDFSKEKIIPQYEEIL